jgi:hypothetical protein
MTSDGRRLYWWAELLTILGFYVVYSFIRNASSAGSGVAYSHARHLIHWERLLGIFHEARLEHWAMHFRPLIISENYIYGSLHFVVTAGALIYLFRSHTNDYPVWRNTLAITTLLALVGFVSWPLMPPRLIDLHGAHYGFVDTLAKYPTFWSFDSGAMSKISNQYAAMPSLHFAWSMFCATSLAPRVRHRSARIALACYPLLTLSAIVLTGNHYFLDAAGGLVVFGLGFWLARRFTRAGRAPAAALNS